MFIFFMCQRFIDESDQAVDIVLSFKFRGVIPIPVGGVGLGDSRQRVDILVSFFYKFIFIQIIREIGVGTFSPQALHGFKIFYLQP